MKMLDAMRLRQANQAREGAPLAVFLAIGFTRLHLETFTLAHLANRSGARRIELGGGLYGDVLASLRGLDPARVGGVLVQLEWADLDPRLGLRRPARWHDGVLDDIAATAESRLGEIMAEVARIAAQTDVVFSPPTLDLPANLTQHGRAARLFGLRLQSMLTAAQFDILFEPRVRLRPTASLDAVSPLSARRDVAGEVKLDFPYAIPHSDALAQILAETLLQDAPLKGIITDLDNTLWRGLVGEEAVHWGAEHDAQMHGHYQQTLARLAAAGTLVAVSSKNTHEVALAALNHPDIGIAPDLLFPLEINWQSKADSVARILAAWNIGADAVVFIDDNPMELAEVAARFPTMQTWQFPTDDAAATLALIERLGAACARWTITDEDRLRRDSLRAGAAMTQARDSAQDRGGFLRQLDAELVVDARPAHVDARLFELINKTNQFNINGHRLTQQDWTDLLADPAGMVVGISYTDKFGPLGRIAVIAGRVVAGVLEVGSFVLSCRAFSRGVEAATVLALFELFPLSAVRFQVQATPKNAPSCDFLRGLGWDGAAAECTVTLAQLDHLREEASHLNMLLHR